MKKLFTFLIASILSGFVLQLYAQQDETIIGAGVASQNRPDLEPLLL